MLVFLAAYVIYFYNAATLLWQYDLTHVSYLIYGIFVINTIYMGIMRENINKKWMEFVGQRFTTVGLIGTVIGIMILMISLGTSNLASGSDVVNIMLKGISTVFLTTLTGLLCSLLTDLQMAFVYGFE